MSPEALFIIALLLGAVVIHIGLKVKRKIKGLIILAGILFALFGSFGVFTSFL